MSKKIKVTLYEDNTIRIDTHPYQPTNTVKNYIPSSKPNRGMIKPQYDYMTKSNYFRLLNKTYKKLFGKRLKQDNSYWVTLSLDNDHSYYTEKRISQEFHKFIVYLGRYFEKPEYIRVLEYHENSFRLHIHTILSFKTNPKEFNELFIEEHLWKIGNVSVKPVSSFMGLLEYTKTKKSSNFHPKLKGYTKFQPNTKIFSMSQGFVIGDKEYKESFVDKSVVLDLLKKQREIKDNGGNLLVDQHVFYNNKSYKPEICIDRLYLR